MTRVAVLALASLLTMSSAQAATVLVSEDAIGRFKAFDTDTDPASGYAGNLAVGPVSGSDDYFRTFLTFDLSGESLATGTTSLALSGTGFTSDDEINDLSLS